MANCPSRITGKPEVVLKKRVFTERFNKEEYKN
jgi:hypothetical protein